jgi:pyruvate/2-oxoglutarate dehydrogenase complex dihydrolipoamide acyltransferase (E2) component
MTLPVLNPSEMRFGTSWRRTAAAIFARPTDGKVTGFVNLDFRPATEAIARWKAQGHRVTPMHIMMAIMARVLGRHVPELNCYSRWGTVIHRGEVVVSTAVLVGGKDLTTLRVHDADKKSVLELSDEVNAGVAKRRSGKDDKLMKKRGGLAKIPWPFRQWVYNAVRWLTYEAGVTIPGLGFNRDMFGSVLITNIGPLGLDNGFPALMPASNLSFVIAIGRVQEQAMVEDGKVIPMLCIPIAGTFDHRVVDGAHVGRFSKALKHYLAHPEDLMD